MTIKTYGNFIPNGEVKEKKQIILCHTSREVGEYLTSLEFRYMSNYNKIPHYVISRNGDIFRLLSDLSYSNIFDEEEINKNSIVIFLENLGWVEKKPLTSDYINWIGNIYSGEVHQKKWRDYIFWQPYTNEQVLSGVELCKKLLKKYEIPNYVVSHNTKMENVSKLNGIVSRSNFDTFHTDLSPAFNFDEFQKKLKI